MEEKMFYLKPLDVEPGGLVLGEVGSGRVHVGRQPLGQRVPQVGGLFTRQLTNSIPVSVNKIQEVWS